MSSQKLTQLDGDDSWNIEWEQQGTLFYSVMYNALHFLEIKCLGLQLELILSASQIP